eukprot:813163-Alexandrium_andersonii.AAC.1
MYSRAMPVGKLKSREDLKLLLQRTLLPPKEGSPSTPACTRAPCMHQCGSTDVQARCRHAQVRDGPADRGMPVMHKCCLLYTSPSPRD